MTDRPREIDCGEAAEKLYEYLDQELDAATEAAVKQHLEMCAPCFQVFDFEKTYLKFIETRARAQGAPESLKRKLLDQLFREGSAAD